MTIYVAEWNFKQGASHIHTIDSRNAKPLYYNLEWTVIYIGTYEECLEATEKMIKRKA